MNNYPQHLSPVCADGTKRPFEDWWPDAQAVFATVPKSVARDWLHRHWGSSPFGWIETARYDFSLEDIPTAQLWNIRSRVFQFEDNHIRAVDTGRHICGDHPGVPFRPWARDPVWLRDFMRAHGRFPTPIVVLDNRDGHLRDMAHVPETVRSYPKGLLLAEGHTRHVIGLYLHSIGQMAETLPVCFLSAR